MILFYNVATLIEKPFTKNKIEVRVDKLLGYIKHNWKIRQGNLTLMHPGEVVLFRFSVDFVTSSAFATAGLWIFCICCYFRFRF